MKFRYPYFTPSVQVSTRDYAFAPVTDYVTADITTLETIADQCPLQGGHAVYRARTLLSTYGGYDYAEDDPSNCGTQALQQANDENTTLPDGKNSTLTSSPDTDQWRIAPVLHDLPMTAERLISI